MRHYEEDREGYEGGTSSGPNPLSLIKALGFVFGAIIAPAAIIAVLIFIVFMRWLKWKPSVTIFPLTITFFALLPFTSRAIDNIKNLTFSTISDEWSTLFLSYGFLSLLAGIVIGYIYILIKAFDLKRYPEYVHITGWAYGFKYAPSPLDKWRKKKNIESLSKGEEFDYEKAPIGVLDAPVIKDDLEGTLDMKNANRAAITYRYYSEAMAHTLITGKTGSGKALHIDTPIFIKEKGWTTVGKAEIGDTLFDEGGKETRLEALYYPMTPDHYKIKFNNGEVIKACGDHLWNIGDVEDENTFDTRTLFENFKDKYFIKHFINGEKKIHEIISIEKIQDNPEDYVCFTVDSPSRLFLITESNIPTHNTVTMLSLIQNDILVGNPICVIDFKKSPDLIYFLSKWAEENGREFYHFVSGKPGTYKNPYKDDQATYDPLSTGNATAKADMILNLRTWDTASEVFKKRTQDVLQSLFFLLERTPRKAVPEIDWDSGGLAQFVSALDLNNFKKMIELMGKDMQAGRLSAGDVRRYNTLVDLYKELSSKTKSDLKAQIVELLSIARTLIVSNYGDWLATGASDYHIDLMDIATSQDGPIVLFSFNQQEEPEFAQYIGSIVMSDISRVSALKNAKGDTTHFGVYIDEFQTLHPMTVKDNLEKARSSKMYITLSLQSIDQIVSAVDSGGEAMANAILDTCANFIFHDGSGYDTAEKMSKIIGKSDRYIYRTTTNEKPGLFSRLISIDKAMVSKDIERDWLVPPSEFQSLESPVESNGYKATAYVINKSSDDNRFKRSGGALARKVHVVVAEETALGVPNDFKKEIFIANVKEQDFEKIQGAVLSEYTEDEFIEKARQAVERRESEDLIVDEHDGDWIIEDEEDSEEYYEVEEDEFEYPPIPPTFNNKHQEKQPSGSATDSLNKGLGNKKFSDGFVEDLLTGLPDLDSFLEDDGFSETNSQREIDTSSKASSRNRENNVNQKRDVNKANKGLLPKETHNLEKGGGNNEEESPLDVFNQLRQGKKK